MTDQRKQFEEWCIDDLMPSEFSSGYLFQRDADGDYEIDFVAHRWEAFKAGRVMQAEDDARMAWKNERIGTPSEGLPEEKREERSPPPFALISKK